MRPCGPLVSSESHFVTRDTGKISDRYPFAITIDIYLGKILEIGRPHEDRSTRPLLSNMINLRAVKLRLASPPDSAQRSRCRSFCRPSGCIFQHQRPTRISVRDQQPNASFQFHDPARVIHDQTNRACCVCVHFCVSNGQRNHDPMLNAHAQERAGRHQSRYSP